MVTLDVARSDQGDAGGTTRHPCRQAGVERPDETSRG